MTEKRRRPFDWAFLFLWMVASSMGWILGQVLPLGMPLVVTGAAMSILQWLVLQTRFAQAWRWLVASAVGWLIGGLLVILAVPVELESLVGVVLGCATGAAQWFVLRREVQWAGWWIPISVVAWSAGLLLMPGIFTSGLTVGVIQGIALELLMRYPKAAEIPVR